MYFIRMHVPQIYLHGEINIRCSGVLGLEALPWFWGGVRLTNFVSISSNEIIQYGNFFSFKICSDPKRFLLLGY